MNRLEVYKKKNRSPPFTSRRSPSPLHGPRLCFTTFPFSLRFSLNTYLSPMGSVSRRRVLQIPRLIFSDGLHISSCIAFNQDEVFFAICSTWCCELHWFWCSLDDKGGFWFEVLHCELIWVGFGPRYSTVNWFGWVLVWGTPLWILLQYVPYAIFSFNSITICSLW